MSATMIREDRILLARLAAANQSLGEVVTRVLDAQVDEHKVAGHLRTIGQELESLGADMVRRADVLDSVVDNDSELIRAGLPYGEPSVR